MIWVMVTALATVGYTMVDNAATEFFPSGPATAARYGIFEVLFSIVVYWLILKTLRLPTGEPNGLSGWKWPAVGAAGVFSSYWLVLWSYQLSAQASYVVAMRQFSIVIGVVVGTFLFKEAAPFLRIGMSLIIAIGIICIAVFG